METLPDYMISLPIPVDINNKWIPTYFQDIDVDKLTYDDIRKFLSFHVEQYYRLSQEQLRSTVGPKESCLQMAKCYAELYSNCKLYLERSNTITEQHLRIYKKKIQYIVERYKPREIIPRTGELPIEVTYSDIWNYFEGTDTFYDEDIIDFLIQQVTNGPDNDLTPPEKAQQDADIEVIENLTQDQINKYRHLIETATKRKVTSEDCREYFIEQQGLALTTPITHKMYRDFLVWDGWDPEELDKVEIHPHEIYDTLERIIGILDNEPFSEDETSDEE